MSILTKQIIPGPSQTQTLSSLTFQQNHTHRNEEAVPEITFPIIFFDFQRHREGEDIAVRSLRGGGGGERSLFGRAAEGSGEAVQDSAHLH